MNSILKVTLSLLLAGGVIFSFFGFLSTYEPLARSVQITWRIVYGGMGLACAAGLAGLWKRCGA